MTVIDEAKRMGYTINKIICDNGSEFLGNFKKMCNEQNIKNEYVFPGDKNKVAPIESLNRTIRGMLERYKIINNINASNIFNTIRKINNLYNNFYHTTLKATPEEILNKKINKNIEEKTNKIYEYDIGDAVRIYIKNDNDPFNKLSPLWSKHIYTIKHYNNRTGYYTLDGLDKQFKYNDLQKIDINNLMLPRITKR